MAVWGMRFDLRNPSGDGTTERVQAALDMAQWADEHGFAVVIISEHHGSADGYNPSALLLASAMAARTRQVAISVSVVPAPLYDPLQLAEQIALLDHVAGGRASVVLGNGYVPSEFAMFDVPVAHRGRLLEEAIETCFAAWTGEPFDHRGRTVTVRPTPATDPRRLLMVGGNSRPAADRAVRHGLRFMPSGQVGWDHFRAARAAAGKKDPGELYSGGTGFVHVAREPERAWEVVGPAALHESHAYGRWAEEAGQDTGWVRYPDLDALKAAGQYRVLTPDAMVAEATGFVSLHPLMGGLPVDEAWACLRLIETEVLPRL
jgi:alkanesulfonate monooxygenase SsuD/methylene tetrahydromethanopterin reductase-like flavin-dependent oxidoreductase (luciferase family)